MDEGKCSTTIQSRHSTHVLAADDGALAGGGVVRAPVLVDAPVARPLRLHARRARRVARTVKVGEIAADKVLVRLRRSNLINRYFQLHHDTHYDEIYIDSSFFHI